MKRVWFAAMPLLAVMLLFPRLCLAAADGDFTEWAGRPAVGPVQGADGEMKWALEGDDLQLMLSLPGVGDTGQARTTVDSGGRSVSANVFFDLRDGSAVVTAQGRGACMRTADGAAFVEYSLPVGALLLGGRWGYMLRVEVSAGGYVFRLVLSTASSGAWAGALAAAALALPAAFWRTRRRRHG